ncbi:MAG TPA: hypothetical protein PL182_12010 [Pseudobdellovibrionaceae bacterium]|nr:hypothetical protein [Pseudobdellovibrionaceae bacterium]
MDRYKVSGEDLRSHYSASTPLGRVFLDIERELRAENRVVCRYIVNGLGLEEKEEARFSNLPLAQIETLEYLSQTEDGLLRDVLLGWSEALPELIPASEDLATRILAGQKDGLIKAVHDLVENCEYLVGSLESIRQLRGDGEDESSFDSMISHLRTVLSEAVRHLEKRDFVLLAQVIEYDFTDGLEELRRALVKLLDSEGEPGADDEIERKDDSVGGGQTSR